MTAVERAQQAVKAADRKVAEAEAALRDAKHARDRAFAEVGWYRLEGVFSPGIELYTHKLYPNASLKADEVLVVLEQQRKAAA
jgi:hypothetical protein